MRTIAVIALKGGSGKTTLAVHMALAAHLRGLKTVMVDSDIQASASDVLKSRGDDGPKWARANESELFAAKLAAVGAGVDLMVVDTAAGAIEDATRAMVMADCSLLVVRPTLMDLSAAVRTVDIIRRLRKPALIIVSQAPTARDGVEPPIVKRALKALEYMRLPVAPVILRSRAIYQTAVETGRSVEECYDVNAAREVAELWAFVERFVFGKPKGKAKREEPAEVEVESEIETEDDLRFAP